MPKINHCRRRWLAVTIAAAVLLLMPAGAALAVKSPFGIATPDTTGPAFTGPLGGLLAWVAFHQAAFYRALTNALGEVRHSGHAFVLLAGISFLYGIFHAVGPGHGKAVITSYLLVSRQTVKRGIVIALAAALLQGVTAIAVVLVAAVLLHTTAVGMTHATDWFEIISYAMIAAVGAWLVWAKVTGRGHHHHSHEHPIASPALAHAHAVAAHGHGDGGHHHHAHQFTGHVESYVQAGDTHGTLGGHDHAHDHGHAHGHDHAHDHGHPHDHAHDADNDGHSHAPDPRLLAKPLTVSRAWAATLAVGIRPCSGAIIVLVFALSQQLLLAGIGSVLAMSLGTFITVSSLAVLAVSAKDVALRIAGLDSDTTERIMRVVEIAGALVVLLLGLTLLGGALQGGLPG